MLSLRDAATQQHRAVYTSCRVGFRGLDILLHLVYRILKPGALTSVLPAQNISTRSKPHLVFLLAVNSSGVTLIGTSTFFGIVGQLIPFNHSSLSQFHQQIRAFSFFFSTKSFICFVHQTSREATNHIPFPFPPFTRTFFHRVLYQILPRPKDDYGDPREAKRRGRLWCVGRGVSHHPSQGAICLQGVLRKF